MKKGITPEIQWIYCMTQTGRLVPVMLKLIHETGKVYHLREERQMSPKLGQIAKFKRRYGEKEGEPVKEGEPEKK